MADVELAVNLAMAARAQVGSSERRAHAKQRI